MKNVQFLLAILACSFTIFCGCSGDDGVSFDPAQQKAVIDSVLQVRTVEVRDSIEEACTQKITDEALTEAEARFQELQTESTEAKN